MRMQIKQILKLVVIITLLGTVVSCQPTIYGARKHRKDRNCGCEMKHQLTTDDDILTYSDNSK